MSKREQVTDFLKKLNKDMGENTAILALDRTTSGVEFNPLGVLSFDLALGGGFAKGRIVELMGMESTGKTTLALLNIAESQKKGETCAFIDVEHALDFEYAEKLGVDMDELVTSQPDDAEKALETLDRMIESGLFSVIVLDSVAALSTQAELAGEMGDKKMAEVARLMSQALRKITAKTYKTGTTVIFINQLREKIGTYVPTTVTSGGNALKFYASQRVEVTRGPQLKDGDEVVGGTMKIRIVKNKVFPPYKKAEVEVIFGEGIDRTKDIITVATKLDLMTRAGAWYSYGDTRLGQGIDKTKDLLEDNPELMDEIIEKVKDKIKK